MAYIFYIDVWESEFDSIACKKDEKTTITFEHSDVTNNIQSSPR